MTNPVGRPSGYDKKYCKYVVDEAKKGRAMIQICSGLGFCASQFRAWAKVHPEFGYAYELAMDTFQACLISRIWDGLENPRFNSRIAETLLKVVCGTERHKGLRVDRNDIAASAIELMARDNLTCAERDYYMSSLEHLSKIHENADVAKGVAEIQEHLCLKNKTRIKVVR